MKSSPTISGLCLIIVMFVSVIAAQDEKAGKNKKSAPKPIEIKVNLMVLNQDNKFVDDVKLQDLKIYEDGAEQKITYFARKEPVLNVGLLFDNSGSMKRNMNEVTSAGKTIITNLNPGDEAFIVRFTDSDRIEITQEWTSDKALLREAIDNLYIEGGATAVLDALYLSAQKLGEREKTDKSKRYAIILFSDAEDRDSYYKFDDTAKMFQGTDIQVFLLSYADNAPQEKKKARKLAARIPLEIGGMVYSLPKKRGSEELNNALKATLTELRSNYIIGYTSTNPKRDGLPRKLTVQIADGSSSEKRQGITRENFVVPKD